MKKIIVFLIVVVVILSGVLGFFMYENHNFKKDAIKVQDAIIFGINSWVSDNEDKEQRPGNINVLNSNEKRVYDYIDETYLSNIGDFTTENNNKLFVLNAEKVVFENGILKIDPNGIDLVYGVLPMDQNNIAIKDYQKYVDEGVLLTSTDEYESRDDVTDVPYFESNFRALISNVTSYFEKNKDKNSFDINDPETKKTLESIKDKPEGATYDVLEKQLVAKYKYSKNKPEYILTYIYEGEKIIVSGAPKDASFENTDKKEDKKEDKDKKEENSKEDKDKDNKKSKENNSDKSKIVGEFESNFLALADEVKKYIKTYRGPTGIESETNDVQKKAASFADKPFKGAKYVVGTSELVCTLPSEAWGEDSSGPYIITYIYAKEETTVEGAPLNYSKLANK